MRIHIVDSVKGGSGKSTVALQIAATLMTKYSGGGIDGANPALSHAESKIDIAKKTKIEADKKLHEAESSYKQVEDDYMYISNIVKILNSRGEPISYVDIYDIEGLVRRLVQFTERYPNERQIITSFIEEIEKMFFDTDKMYAIEETSEIEEFFVSIHRYLEGKAKRERRKFNAARKDAEASIERAENEINEYKAIIDSISDETQKAEGAPVNAGQKARPVIVDVDILGTSWESLYGNTLKPNPKETPRTYLDELIDDFGRCTKRSFICSLPYGGGLTDKNLRNTVDIILCDPDPTVKRRFKAANAGGYVREIRYSQFRYTLLKLIGYLRDHEYTDIIFDMPPNSDSYSDQLFDVVLDTEEKQCYKNGDRVFLYMVSAYNRSHILANWEWLRDFFHIPASTRWDMKRIQPIFLLNETVELKNSFMPEHRPGSNVELAGPTERMLRAIGDDIRETEAGQMPPKLFITAQTYHDDIAKSVFERAFKPETNSDAITSTLTDLELVEPKLDAEKLYEFSDDAEKTRLSSLWED